ncbi:MAG TPA: hypothetical protein VGJ20_45405 [Xanthobacteraceae bacterium]|jgi:hypothetical protein
MRHDDRRESGQMVFRKFAKRAKDRRNSTLITAIAERINKRWTTCLLPEVKRGVFL